LRKATILKVYIFSDYGDEKKKKTEEATKTGKEENTKSQEEKRKHIKSLIDKIPTDKNALFGYQLDWALIDNVSVNIHIFRKYIFVIIFIFSEKQIFFLEQVSFPSYFKADFINTSFTSDSCLI